MKGVKTKWLSHYSGVGGLCLDVKVLANSLDLLNALEHVFGQILYYNLAHL